MKKTVGGCTYVGNSDRFALRCAYERTGSV